MDIGDNEEEEIDFIATMQGTITQHGIGGLLCLPSAMGVGFVFPSGMAVAMANHGALCEIGHEIQDMLCKIYDMIFGGEQGRKKNPISLWFATIAHHSCALCLVVPMNIFYWNNRYYHEMTMWMQFAAFFAFTIQQYGYTLDTKSQEGLIRMKISVCLGLIIMVWTRVIRYFWLWIILGAVIWEDQNWIVIKAAILPFLGLTLINVYFVVDATAKFLKFMPMKIEKQS